MNASETWCVDRPTRRRKVNRLLLAGHAEEVPGKYSGHGGGKDEELREI